MTPQDVMSVRGRAERMAFAETFTPIFDYRTLYPSPAVYYPIVGAVYKCGPRDPWVAFERQEERVSPAAAPWAGRNDDSDDDVDMDMGDLESERDQQQQEEDAYFVNTAGVKLRERHVARATYDEPPTDAQVLKVLRRGGAKWKAG